LPISANDMSGLSVECQALAVAFFIRIVLNEMTLP